MSLDKFYFDSLDALRAENATLYHALQAYIKNVVNGSWSYSDGFDPSGNGDRYCFTFVSTRKPAERLAVTAVKDGFHFSFSSNPSPIN